MTDAELHTCIEALVAEHGLAAVVAAMKEVVIAPFSKCGPLAVEILKMEPSIEQMFDIVEVAARAQGAKEERERCVSLTDDAADKLLYLCDEDTSGQVRTVLEGLDRNIRNPKETPDVNIE